MIDDFRYRFLLRQKMDPREIAANRASIGPIMDSLLTKGRVVALQELRATLVQEGKVTERDLQEIDAKIQEAIPVQQAKEAKLEADLNKEGMTLKRDASGRMIYRPISEK